MSYALAIALVAFNSQPLDNAGQTITVQPGMSSHACLKLADSWQGEVITLPNGDTAVLVATCQPEQAASGKSAR